MLKFTKSSLKTVRKVQKKTDNVTVSVQTEELFTYCTYRQIKVNSPADHSLVTKAEIWFSLFFQLL